MKTLSTETPTLFEAAIAEAASALQRGEVVAVPTETVYGLAANAFDPAAVRRIFEAKERPAHNPLIVHVASIEMARSCVADWPDRAEALAKEFWPGPLSLILPKAPIVPDEVTAGGSTVAIRWPSHPFMQALIRRCGFPLAAPSANRSNQLSPTNAAHVQRGLEGRIGLLIDGGQCQVGIESTVYDVTTNRILRPGMISAEALRSAGSSAPSDGPLRSPGMLPKHYSPRAKILVATWRNGDEAAQFAGASIANASVIAHEIIPTDPRFASVSVIPHDAEAYARALYSELHRLDALGVEAILVEQPPAGPEWEGIRDRLKRAAS